MASKLGQIGGGGAGTGPGGTLEAHMWVTADLLTLGGNPVVFFDITIGGHNAGRIKIELFADEVPK